MNYHTNLFICAAVALTSTAAIIGCGHHNNNNEPSRVFHFSASPASAYTQIDRVGMPAVATALITNKDLYNTKSPQDDVSGTFTSEITGNLDTIHTKLNDDVTHAGLVPTDTAGSLSNAGSAIIPDTLKINTAAPAGFPNGRRLTDRVIDQTLSLLLLQQSGGQGINTLANIPLNPGANDKAFSTDFPYLAAPF